MSGITGKEDISLVREDVKESRHLVKAAKTLVFKHEATAGQLEIDLSNLTLPTVAAANGFVQPGSSELAAANLMANKKNFSLRSSRGVELEQYEDFIITGNQKIQLIGNIASLGGALEGEIFTGRITPVISTAIMTTDARTYTKTYTLPAGQTLLNLGVEYEVGVGLLTGEQIGIPKVTRDGIPQFRNVSNAAASPSADGNYQEIDSGNGYGSTLQFNVAKPTDSTIIVEYGVKAAGDFSLIGDMESLMGAFMKLITDVAANFDYDTSRYLDFNPSGVERRAFGDTVVDLLTRMTALDGQSSSDKKIDIGPFRIQWGNYLHNVAINTNQTVTLPFSYAAANFYVFLQAQNQTNMTFGAGPVSVNQFNVQTPVGGTPQVSYLTIGVK